MGNRLRILRKTRNLTQEVVSSELGISQQTLSRCEIDITTLQIDLLYKIAQYYNVSTDYILGLSDNKWTTEQNILVNQFFLKYQDIFEAFEALDDYDKELMNNPVPVSLLSGDRKPQIRFLGNHPSGSGNLYHKSFRM